MALNKKALDIQAQKVSRKNQRTESFTENSIDSDLPVHITSSFATNNNQGTPSKTSKNGINSKQNKLLDGEDQR